LVETHGKPFEYFDLKLDTKNFNKDND